MLIQIVEDDRGTAKADVMHQGGDYALYTSICSAVVYGYHKRVCGKVFWGRDVFLQMAFHNAAPCRLHPHIAWGGGSGADSLPQSAE